MVESQPKALFLFFSNTRLPVVHVVLLNMNSPSDEYSLVKSFHRAAWVILQFTSIGINHIILCSQEAHSNLCLRWLSRCDIKYCSSILMEFRLRQHLHSWPCGCKFITSAQFISCDTRTQGTCATCRDSWSDWVKTSVSDSLWRESCITQTLNPGSREHCSPLPSALSLSRPDTPEEVLLCLHQVLGGFALM